MYTLTAASGERAVSADWSGVYAEYADALLAFCTKQAGNAEVGAEIFQDTFVRAIRAGPPSSGLRPWLYQIALNLCRDYHRRRQLLRFVPFRGADPATETDDFDGGLVRRALATLSPKLATTLLLHYEAGFSREEIARIEGVSEEGVKSRLARARIAFAREYARLGGEL